MSCIITKNKSIFHKLNTTFYNINIISNIINSITHKVKSKSNNINNIFFIVYLQFNNINMLNSRRQNESYKVSSKEQKDYINCKWRGWRVKISPGVHPSKKESNFITNIRVSNSIFIWNPQASKACVKRVKL
jgi:hypothetical protein